MDCTVDPMSMSEFVFTTNKLERFCYWPDHIAVDAQDFDAFWIRTALLFNARDTLKSLTIAAYKRTRKYMGSLKSFGCLEFLETDLRLLIGDPPINIHTPSSILPDSTKEVKLHVDHLKGRSTLQVNCR